MKVLLIQKYSGYGGVNTFVRNLNEKLKELRIKSLLITAPPSLHFYRKGLSSKTSLASYIPNTYKFLSYLDKKIQKEKPDVIHSQSFVDSLLALKYKNFLQTVHDIHSITCYIIQQRIPFFHHLITKLSRFQKFVVAPSQLVKKGLILMGFKNIKIIPHGVDTKFFYKRVRKKIKNSILMINPTFKKGFFVLRNLNYIFRELPPIKIYLVNCPYQLPKKYSSKITNFINPSNEELVKIYSKTEVFLLPSLYEPFGLVALEAMACGCVPIVSNMCGVADLIINGENGFVLPLKNFVEGMIKILKNVDLTKLSKKCEKYAKKFDWKFTAKEYLKLYEEVQT